MEKFKALLKRSLDLWVKKRWLKEIDRVVNNCNKSRDKLQRDTCVLAVLINRYNELYPDRPFKAKSAKQAEPAKAKWQFWEGWMSNHDMRIDDATCSNCGYKHHTVRRTPYSNESEQDVLNKLGNFCPNCGKPMIKNNN